MPSRPNEHSSLGVPVGGCSHHLKCDWLTRSVGRQRLEIPAAHRHNPHTLAAAKRACEGACIPRLTLTGVYEVALDNVVRTFRVCGGGARSSDAETATRGRSPS